jgi:RND family efflux transporter MFP subunit
MKPSTISYPAKRYTGTAEYPAGKPIYSLQMKPYIFLAIVLASLLQACADSPAASKPKNSQPAAPHYTLYKAGAAPVAETVQLPAQLTAYQEVSIFPKVNGYVQKVLVDIGSKVHKGQLLMTLEAPELQQASMQAREKYAQYKAHYTISRENYYRLLEAFQTPGAISPMDLASAKAKMQADSALCNAEKLNWQMQETMLAYLQVTAPFDGVITDRNVHPGALVSAAGKDSKPMLELKQVDHLRLQVDVPESMAAELSMNQPVSFYLSAFPGKKMTAAITRKSMNVNLQYRTERVELDVWNKEGLLTPGMYADVTLDAKGSKDALTVPATAVVTSTERKYVIVVRNGKTARVDVITGNSSNGKVEIFGNLKPGEEVIDNANDEIKEGTTI